MREQLVVLINDVEHTTVDLLLESCYDLTEDRGCTLWRCKRALNELAHGLDVCIEGHFMEEFDGTQEVLVQSIKPSQEEVVPQCLLRLHSNLTKLWLHELAHTFASWTYPIAHDVRVDERSSGSEVRDVALTDTVRTRQNQAGVGPGSPEL